MSAIGPSHQRTADLGPGYNDLAGAKVQDSGIPPAMRAKFPQNAPVDAENVHHAGKTSAFDEHVAPDKRTNERFSDRMTEH
jgi:hypothetical protein